MRWWSVQREALAGISKTELRTAVDATDAWIEANQASFNSALPVAFRSNATLAQKTLLLCAVAVMRVSLPLARALFGEVD
jgi:hypothetical protein